ncbi:MAG: flagellar biosynthesis protein FlhF, partial [Candidatus Dadabacteria bacterium]
MIIKEYTGENLEELYEKISNEIGDDALILNSKHLP